jgi:hypothetical protein
MGITIKFIRNNSPYRVNDVATFMNERYAALLIEGGIAEVISRSNNRVSDDVVIIERKIKHRNKNINKEQ